ncbi:hypothetical protein [Ensifer sp. B1-9]|uniref:hypothetical protein n=1 Tax=Ensifer sp. B1-9 TaxID=3141455 RepID=UPI003D22F48F
MQKIKMLQRRPRSVLLLCSTPEAVASSPMDSAPTHVAGPPPRRGYCPKKKKKNVPPARQHDHPDQDFVSLWSRSFNH